MTHSPDPSTGRLLDALIRAQRGVVARRQLLAYGVDADRVRSQLTARRWVERTPTVVSTTTGELTVPQRRWLGVLHAGPRSMLGGLTAAAQHGLTGWDREAVTVLVDDQLSFEPVPGLHIFRTRRPFDELLAPRPGIPTCRMEPAVLLFAGYDAPTPRAAQGVLAAAVQQRLTTAARLADWVERLRPLRRASLFRAVLRDIEEGAHSTAELDVGRMCRRFRLPRPHRQRQRTDSSGRRRWTDVEWELPDGLVVVLEIDGSFHVEAVEWTEDLRRHRRLTSRSRLVVRCSAFELRHWPHEVAADLIALGIPGRVPQDVA